MLSAGASIIMIFFLAVNSAAKCHSWLKRSSNQITYTTEMISDNTQTVGESITCLVTFWLAPNSWSLTWSHLTFLSAIITTFLEYTWRVGSSNKMSMLSPSICFDYLSGQTERENMAILFLGTTRTHCISPMTIAMITDWKCRDQVIDQELVAHNVTMLRLTSDHYSREHVTLR